MDKIDSIDIKLPKKEKSLNNFYKNCEHRKKFIESDKEYFNKHLRKAKHDLYRAEREFEDNCWDWTVVKAYYSLHHSANALLLKKKGFFCKDHSCLIVALKYHDLVDKNLFNELSDIHESFSDILGLELTFQLRKISQYNVNEWEKITREDASILLSISKKLLKFVENA